MVPLTKLASLSCVFAILHQVSTQTGVCQRAVSSTQNYRVYVSIASGYTRACGLFWLFRCSETRYRAMSQLRTRTIYHTQSTCCSGYQGDGIQCDPVCTECSEPGRCIAPDTCECPPGWTGNQCLEDIDECVAGICDNCINNEGSFQCVCPDGSILPSGQLSCIESPQIVSVNATSSSSLLVSWEPPNLDEMDGQLLSYSVSCSQEDNNEETPEINQITTLSVSVLELSPYIAYECCVEAETTVGISGVSCLTKTTLEDVPSGPPEDVTVTAVSPFAVEIEWRYPNIPNGVITYYSIYFNNTLVAEVNGSTLNNLYDGLLPYQQVSVCISSSTEVGEGPKSATKSIRTQESVPGVVENMNVEVLNDSVLHVSWEPSISPNGVITEYRVTVTNLIGNVRYEHEVQSDQLELIISNGFEPYIPFDVAVSASTVAGTGEARHRITFTREGVPLVSPSILSIRRTDATSALIEWELVSLNQLRGNLTAYEIVYFELEEDCSANSNIYGKNKGNVSVEAIQPVFSLTDLLDPRLEYCIGIAARTGAGIGPYSSESISWYSNSMFAVVIEVMSCQQWIDDLPLDKAGDLVIEISSGIEQYCQCDFPSDYIADTKFLCNEKQPDVVVFQGRIIRTDERDSGSLVVGLENWASDKPTVIVQGERVQIDSSTEPANSNSNQDASDPWTAIGVAITVAILLLSGSLVTIIGCTIYCKKRQKRQKDESYNTDNIIVKDRADTLKDLKNPFYGYSENAADKTNETDEGYCEVRKEPIEENVVANPTYGMTVQNSANNSIVLNPLYGGEAAPHGKVEVIDSASGLYTEIPSSKDKSIYDTPATRT